MGISSFLAFSQYLRQFLAFEGEKRFKNGPKKLTLEKQPRFILILLEQVANEKANDQAVLKKQNYYEKMDFGR